MRELYRSEHFLMTVDDARGLLRRARTAQPYASFAEIERVYEELLRAMEAVDRRRHAVLLDVRLAPPRNDPAFEQLIRLYRMRLFNGFRRAAILTKTEAGRLQIGRLYQDLPFEVRTFLDEATAIAYLLAPAPPSSRP
jgi:hypothetical protein